MCVVFEKGVCERARVCRATSHRCCRVVRMIDVGVVSARLEERVCEACARCVARGRTSDVCGLTVPVNEYGTVRCVLRRVERVSRACVARVLCKRVEACECRGAAAGIPRVADELVQCKRNKIISFLL